MMANIQAQGKRINLTLRLEKPAPAHLMACKLIKLTKLPVDDSSRVVGCVIMPLQCTETA